MDKSSKNFGDLLEVVQSFIGAVKTLYEKPNANMLGSSFYTDMYNICSVNDLDKVFPVYYVLKNLLSEYASSQSEKILQGKGRTAISSYAQGWRTFQSATITLNKICFKFNEILELKLREVGCGKARKISIKAVGYSIWKKKITTPIFSVKPDFMQTMLEVLGNERNGISDSSIEDVRLCIRSFLCLGKYSRVPDAFYTKCFEDPYVNNAQSCYQAISKSAKPEKFYEYVQVVLESVKSEMRLCDMTVFSHTIKKVTNACYIYAVLPHIKLINQEFSLLLNANEYERCSEMQKLFNLLKVDNDSFLELFEEKVYQEARTIFEGFDFKEYKDNLGVLLEGFLDLKARMKTILTKHFAESEKYMTSMDRGFSRSVLNLKNVSLEYILAKLADNYLSKHTNVNLIPAERAKSLRSHTEILRYVHNKDDYKKTYMLMFGKRLIYENSAGYDLELGMISNIASVFGNSFTINLRRMLMDINISKELAAQFESSPYSHLKKDVPNPFILIISSCFWPKMDFVEYNPPLHKNIEQKLNNFRDFYHTTNCGKQLKWLKRFFKFKIIVNCPNKSYKLTCNHIDASVLLLFDGDVSDNCVEITAHEAFNELDFKIKIEEVTRSLEMFVKAELLVKSGTDNPKYKFNNGFEKDHAKIILDSQRGLPKQKEPIPSVLENMELVKKTILVVIKEDRRILKDLLLSKTCAQLNTGTCTNLVEKCVSDLLDQDIISLDESDTGYLYYNM